MMGISRRVLLSVLAGVVTSLVLNWVLDWINPVDIDEYYKDKRVVVTGASKGIGRELAIQLANAGAELFIVARSKDLLQATYDECRKFGGKIHTMTADVGKEEDCEMLAEAAVSEMGGVDILILNAAYSPKPTFFNRIENPNQAFKSVFQVNILQSVNLVHYLLPSLNSSRGHVIAVSSAASMIGMPQVSAYSTSKHALNGFFKSLRQEFYLEKIPVDITIMPLPYVLTEKAVQNWRPIGDGGGWTTEACVKKIVQTLPYRRAWIYIDWSSYLISIISSACPQLTEYAVRNYIAQTSYLFN